MKILILGGTRFLGRHLVDKSLARNHEVTIFNRGNYPSHHKDVELIVGDRNSDLHKLAGGRWDAVIDTCGYLPRTVRSAAVALSALTDRYVFISSISVYADFKEIGKDETAPVATLTEDELAEANLIDSSGKSGTSYGKLYGPLKALCEQAVADVRAERSLVIRPGLIVGPYDYTDRFTYWVWRVSLGGEVLAPARPDKSLQFIDARDLAELTIKMVEDGQIGVYNASGVPKAVTMKLLLEECKAVAGTDAEFTWVDEAFLLAENVAAWSEMPLWMPEDAAPDFKGFMFVNCDRAFAAGLQNRPISETINDTLNWWRSERGSDPPIAGIDREKEKEVLERWHKCRFIEH
ncbi:MAG TPA: NAD-dependent epimerase/dehydratase family protein [Pyrinomonadaceae bacterium]|nr:NAD-dependent epimerase/dehydratase family protein [Pyrinomonadaceae bacterium]